MKADLSKDAPILIVEDSDEDFEILEITMRDQGIVHPIVRLAEGAHVIPELERRVRIGEALPAFILLDLNLIGFDGRTVLKHLKEHEILRILPVIIRSTSSNPRDVEFCHTHGAAAYCVKPVALEDLEKFVAALKSFWIDCALLPFSR